MEQRLYNENNLDEIFSGERVTGSRNSATEECQIAGESISKTDDSQVPYPHTRLVRPCFWASNVFRCYDDWRICCVTSFCPCVTFGRIAEIADGRSSCCEYGFLYCFLSLLCLQNFYSFVMRTKLRAKYSLPNLPCNDFCIHCCCERCALCQERREIKYRSAWLDIVTLGPPVPQQMQK